jgi:hypothetical protein
MAKARKSHGEAWLSALGCFSLIVPVLGLLLCLSVMALCVLSVWVVVSEDNPTQKVPLVSVTRCFDAQGGIVSRSAYCETVVRLPGGGERPRTMQGGREDMPAVGSTVYANGDTAYASRGDAASAGLGPKTIVVALAAGVFVGMVALMVSAYRRLARPREGRRTRRNGLPPRPA